jgi:hypothetical protein
MPEQEAVQTGEESVYQPSPEFVRRANVQGMEAYRALYARAETQPEEFCLVQSGLSIPDQREVDRNLLRSELRRAGISTTEYRNRYDQVRVGERRAAEPRTTAGPSP